MFLKKFYKKAGKGARTKALELEKKHTNSNSSSINKELHKIPKPEQ